MVKEALTRIVATYPDGRVFRPASARVVAASHPIDGQEAILVGWTPEGEPTRWFTDLATKGGCNVPKVFHEDLLALLLRDDERGDYYEVRIHFDGGAPVGLTTVEQLERWAAWRVYCRLPYKYVTPEEF